MKTLLPLIVLMLLAPMKASADPYFRVIGPGNYHIYDGALFDANDIKNTQNTTVAAIITHSTKDGSILPKSWVDAGFAEAWTPLALGGSVGGNSANLNFGPIVNVNPIVQGLAYKAIDSAFPDSLSNLKAILKPGVATPGKVDMTIAYGVMLNAEIVQNGAIAPFNQWWHNPARFYWGPALHF